MTFVLSFTSQFKILHSSRIRSVQVQGALELKFAKCLQEGEEFGVNLSYTVCRSIAVARCSETRLINSAVLLNSVSKDILLTNQVRAGLASRDT